jgi:RNA polymerase sigma-70 factor (ECF subfamily)
MGRELQDPMATPPTIFGRLRHRDPRAWEDFVSRYQPMILGWCRRWFPREADDMAQEVFVKLIPCLGRYDYDPRKGRFRGWLKTVTHNLMAELKRRPQPPVIDDEVLRDEAEAPDDLEQRLAAMFDLERLAEARERVRARVKPSTWWAYVETAERGRPATEVGCELGLSFGAVHQAKYKVITSLRREIEDLEGLP